MKYQLLITFLLAISFSAKATTWDEPWADKVIQGADYFVLAKVIQPDPEKGVTIEILETLGGSPLTGTLVIDGFYMLSLCSSSGGDGPQLRIGNLDSCFLFLKKNSRGNYSIATPTTGFDPVDQHKVVATYRHSFHKSFVPVPIYLATMKTIFDRYHGKSIDQQPLLTLFSQYLVKAPAGFEEKEIEDFFIQHALLETIYHTGIEVNSQLLLPFMKDRGNFHHQVSAMRALRSVEKASRENNLLSVIADTSYRDFVRVIALESLAEQPNPLVRERLQPLIATASTEVDNFQANIMDPRVCTHRPTLRAALEAYLSPAKKS